LYVAEKGSTSDPFSFGLWLGAVRRHLELIARAQQVQVDTLTQRHATHVRPSRGHTAAHRANTSRPDSGVR